MRKQLLTLLFLCGWLLAGTSIASAAGIVGDGNPSSCTEAALTTALTGGGVVTFNCGSNPLAITLTSDKSITTTTTINGGNKVTLRKGAFVVATGATLTLNNLILAESTHAALVNNGGTVTINASHFLSNTNLSGDGGAIVNQNGALTINSTTFENNQAGNGGAIASTGGAPILIDDSDFLNNRAAIGNGGAISTTAQYAPITIQQNHLLCQRGWTAGHRLWRRTCAGRE